MDISFGSPSSGGNTSKLNYVSPESRYLPPFLLGNDTEMKQNQSTSLFESFSEYNTSSPRMGQAGRKVDGSRTVSFIDCEIKENLSSTRNKSSIASPRHDNTGTESYIDRSLYSRPDGNSEMWITVFGFAHSALPRVLSYFSQYGSIIETKPSKNGGNWVHIRYSSRFEVNNALSRNGKKIQPGLIIGVMLCDEPEVLDSLTLSRTVGDIPSIRLQNIDSPPLSLPARRLNSHLADDAARVCQTYNGNTGSLGKTLQYFFGW